MKYCVLIPAYNEQRTIATIVERVKAHCPTVVVVDDGSSDGTPARAREAGAVVLRHPWNMGKGMALTTGFAWAEANGFEFVATVDADGQHDPAELPNLLKAAEDADIVIGCRLTDLSSMPKVNRFGNVNSTRFVSYLAGQDVGDSQSGYRIISVATWMGLDLRTDGFDTETEMLIQAGRQGRKIAKVPIQTIYTGKEDSKFRIFRDSARIVWIMARYWMSGLLEQWTGEKGGS